MANRYWVGGYGNWNSSNTTNWSASSGGAGGASVPSASDNVYFDANSGLGQATITDATASCNNFDNSASSVTLYISGGSYGLHISGSATFGGPMVWASSAAIYFIAPSGSQTITTNGYSFKQLMQIGASGSTATWTLQDNLNSPNLSIFLEPGTFVTNGKTITVQNIDCGFGTLSMGASIINIGSFGFQASYGTIIPGTSTIKMTGGGNFSGGGKTYYNLELASNTTITGSNTFNTLTVDAGRTVKFTNGTTQTASSLVANGSSSIVYFRSDLTGSTYTIALGASGTATVQYVDAEDCIATGTHIPIDDTVGGANSGNNTGWTFPSAPTVITNSATSVNAYGATLNGNITIGGGSPITRRGLCFSTSSNPTTSDNHIDISGTTGTFSYAIGNLNPNTTYHVRAYAITSLYGTTYGSDISFATTSVIPKTYIYKTFTQGVYVGDLPSVISDFGYSQDINTAGSQITITCGISADTSSLPTPTIDDETSVPIQDETGDNLLAEGYPDVVGDSATVINNGNKIQVWEYSSYHPNGQLVFQGEINRWNASFGGDNGSDTVDILVYSDGQELTNYLVQGSPYLTDQVQTQHDNLFLAQGSYPTRGAFSAVGQTITAGSSVTNIGAIDLYFDVSPDPLASVTVTVWPDVATANAALGSATGPGMLATTTLTPGTTGVSRAAFPVPAAVTAGGQYFVTIFCPNSAIYVGYQDTDVYSNGDRYNANYGGAGGGTNFTNNPPPVDLYFVTYSNSGATTAIYTDSDPATGMLEPFMSAYASAGGSITYNSASIDSPNLSLTYSFNTNTISEGIDACLRMSPYDWYWYVDVGSDILYFKQTAQTAKYILAKGVDIAGLELSATIENLVNMVYFAGGLVAGSNLYSNYLDTTSITKYGQRLDRQSDNRVTLQATADALGNSEIQQKKNQDYQTTVTLLDSVVDISLYRVGDTVGFTGFGNFIDFLVLQIVRVVYSPDRVTLTLGKLPPRLNVTVAQALAELVALQTINNPSTPV